MAKFASYLKKNFCRVTTWTTHNARIVRIALLILIAALATILGGHYLLR